MELTFGNMTLELNVFNLSKQQNEEEDKNEEVNVIETVVKDHIEKDKDWKPKELEKQNEEKQEEPSKLEPKPPPEGLRYVYHGEALTYPMATSSSFTTKEEGKYLMDSILSKLHNRFPSLPPNALFKIYKTRITRLGCLMIKGMPTDVRWLIEAKVRFSFEFPDAFVSYMPGLGKSSYSKKRRAKRLQVCHKCARWTCNQRCRSIGFTSNNREDKLQFIKYGLSRESLDNVSETLETHPSGLVQSEICKLWMEFQDERKRYSLGNLTLNDPVCQFIRKLDGKHILNS